MLDADARQAREPANIRTARRAFTRLELELDRVLAAIRAGMDPELAATTTRKIQAELGDARYSVEQWEHSNDHERRLTADEIALALDHAGSLAQLLTDAEREPRARLYRTLGLELQLDVVADPKTVDARLQLSGGGGRI